MTTRDGRGGPSSDGRDPWLAAALRHAPDADQAPPPAVNAAILAAAARSAEAARQPEGTPRGGAAGRVSRGPLAWLAAGFEALTRPQVATGFAGLLVAVLVGVMWHDRPLEEGMPAPPAPGRAASPTGEVTATAPAEPRGAAAPAAPAAPTAADTVTAARPPTQARADAPAQAPAQPPAPAPADASAGRQVREGADEALRREPSARGAGDAESAREASNEARSAAARDAVELGRTQAKQRAEPQALRKAETAPAESAAPPLPMAAAPAPTAPAPSPPPPPPPVSPGAADATSADARTAAARPPSTEPSGASSIAAAPVPRAAPAAAARAARAVTTSAPQAALDRLLAAERTDATLPTGALRALREATAGRWQRVDAGAAGTGPAPEAFAADVRTVRLRTDDGHGVTLTLGSRIVRWQEDGQAAWEAPLDAAAVEALRARLGAR